MREVKVTSPRRSGRVDPRIIGAIAVPLLVVGAFFALVLLRGEEGALEVNARDGTVSWTPAERAISEERAQELDTGEYFIDSTLGFAFKKLQAPFGVAERLRAQELSRRKGVELDVGDDPVLAPIFGSAEIVRFSAGRESRLRFSAATRVRVYGTEISGTALEFVFANELIVWRFAKSDLGGLSPTIAQLYGLLSMQIAPFFQEVTTSDTSILSIAQIDFSHVAVGERTASVHIDRAFLATESATAYYVVEIQFSNELGQSADLWRQLRDAVESFRIIDA